MMTRARHISTMVASYLLAAFAALTLALALSSCAGSTTLPTAETDTTSEFLTFLDEEPQSADPQVISENYTVVLNVFDRLVEVDEDNDNNLAPSLAESWEVSDDGLAYTFHLREGVTFSNGEALTSQDVYYTFYRLLTHPGSCNFDIATEIVGASDLREGRADTLAGFHIVDDHTFVITLEKPYAAFLAGLSTPGASILDETTTRMSGSSFGTSVATTVGTGPFVLTDWTYYKSITMTANASCWAGAPRCAGLHMLFYTEHDPLRTMFADGEIDILDLDALDMTAEYFLHGDIYLTNLIRSPRVGITYIALNESVKPLDNVRVRKALQLALDRQTILQACVGGRGVLENGIFPRGLAGHNDDLETIPYDQEQARQLLAEAGYEDGFDLTLSYNASAPQNTRDILRLAASMWEEIGVHATVTVLDDESFFSERKAGRLDCYTATWSADYNDPDNFIYTFFGTTQNTMTRSLCYTDEDVMKRVQDARSIVQEDERIAEYQALEKKIIQEDAAWIPLYSRYHFFVVSDRVEGFKALWNGWSSNRYDNVALVNEQ